MEEKRRTRKAVLMIFAGIGVIIVSIFLGFKALTTVFLFISNFNNSNKVSTKDDFIPPSPPQLFLPYEATNSAQISIRGFAEPGATVYVTLNKNPLKNVIVSEEGEYFIDEVKLESGKNDFSAVAIDKAGNESQQSNLKSIIYSDKIPKLEITNPADNAKISGKDSFVEIKGNTDPENRLTINERVIILNSSGSFNYRLGLSNGENKILISATDRTGNKKEVTLTVNYGL